MSIIKQKLQNNFYGYERALYAHDLLKKLPCHFQAMCVEKECVLQLPSNPLFTPVPVMDGRFPLKDCVLSVSQFTGAERESLVDLAKHLGAKYGCISV